MCGITVCGKFKENYKMILWIFLLLNVFLRLFIKFISCQVKRFNELLLGKYIGYNILNSRVNENSETSLRFKQFFWTDYRRH